MKLNQKIDEIIAEFELSNPGVIFPGPNFFDDPMYDRIILDNDGIHPKGQGYSMMGNQWGEVIVIRFSRGL